MGLRERKKVFHCEGDIFLCRGMDGWMDGWLGEGIDVHMVRELMGIVDSSRVSSGVCS